MDAEESFLAYVRERVAALSRIAFLLTGDRHLAEDLVQETLLRVVGRWARIAAGGDPDAYVRRALYHQHVSAWRRHRGRTVHLETQRPPERAGPDEAGAVTDSVAVRAALATLAPKQRAGARLGGAGAYTADGAGIGVFTVVAGCTTDCGHTQRNARSWRLTVVSSATGAPGATFATFGGASAKLAGWQRDGTAVVVRYVDETSPYEGPSYDAPDGYRAVSDVDLLALDRAAGRRCCYASRPASSGTWTWPRTWSRRVRSAARHRRRRCSRSPGGSPRPCSSSAGPCPCWSGSPSC
ncbi:hypothetical protein OHA72_30020 [Dactylosporangium sp. NBC_01737]|uniref:sigma factor n=1 Tax=Dactylosporangium sp. NBC_01737 TaxID=2975959 RepID=UPI002E152342|nr:hypothetical protein OHA72_30020 [Dactylosporangium sp. NBC_01737]